MQLDRGTLRFDVVPGKITYIGELELSTAGPRHMGYVLDAVKADLVDYPHIKAEIVSARPERVTLDGRPLAPALPPPPQFTLEYMKSPELVNQALRLATHMEEILAGNMPPCASGYTITPVQIGIVTPVKFAESEYPTEGAWTYDFRADGCGKQPAYKAIVRANFGRVPIFSPLRVGTTFATGQLLEDAEEAVRSFIATTGSKECEEFGIVGWRVVKARIADAPWEEVWTAGACGKREDVSLCFTPQKTGEISVTQGHCL